MGLLFNTTRELFKAARKGDTATVAKYLKADSASWLAARDKEGHNVIHIAAQAGQTSVIRQLLEAGADIEQPMTDGQTPLIAALMWSQDAVVEFLLEKGADPNKKGGPYTPLPFAAARGNTAVVKILLAAKADPSAGDPIVAAAQYNRYDIATLLMEAGAKLDAHNGYYQYLIHFAAMHNARDFVSALIEKGADINIQDTHGYTPLHHAVMYGQKQIVDLLLEKGAQTDLESNQGQTPLQLARDKQNPAIVKTLAALEKKAEPVPAFVPAAPAHSAANANGESEVWVRMGDSRVAHVGTYPAIGRKLTEIFNFTSRERITITENLRTGQENMTPAESFDTIAEEAVKKALAAFRSQGGKADDETVLNPRGIKKQLRQP